MIRISLICLTLLTSCEACITSAVFPGRDKNICRIIDPCQGEEGQREAANESFNGLLDPEMEVYRGIGYIQSCEACMLAAGEAYEESKDQAGRADEYLPPGEHPLDDERIDEWDGTLTQMIKGDIIDKHVSRFLEAANPDKYVHSSAATWGCRKCGQNNHQHQKYCSSCGTKRL